MRADTLAHITGAGTCTIQRATTAQTATGGISQSWANLATGVAVRFDEPKTGGPEQPINQAIGTAVKLIAHVAYNQDVTVKDRIVYGVLTYEVQEVLDTASWLMSRRLVVTRID